MSNISFPKDMTGWSQREIKPVGPPETDVKEAAGIGVLDAEELNFDLMLKHCNTLLSVLMDETAEIYSIHAHKEINDARIHLAMAKNLLKAVK